MSTALRAALQQKIDNKTKPQGALGKLEQVALQVGLIQGSLSPQLSKPHVLLFAGDHGVVAEGVSPFPQAVTQQMVANFVNGGAAINVFCRQHGIAIDVVDAGVNADLSALDIIHAKIAPGTNNYAVEPAMSAVQLQLALQRGAAQVERVAQTGCNVIGFGEMGIGNTSSAALVFACLSGHSLAECTGRGTGLDAHGLDHKIAVLARALEKHGVPATPEAVLATYGGFELVMIVGAALRAAELNMVILVDGFIVTAAIIAACAMRPALRDNLLFTHLSDERGHRLMLDYLQAEPLLQLNMRLGEGSGVAVTWPLVQSAVAFLNEMASFAEAGVSDRNQ